MIENPPKPTVINPCMKLIKIHKACADCWTGEGLELPVRLDEMTEREKKIADVASKLAGTVMWILNYTQEDAHE